MCEGSVCTAAAASIDSKAKVCCMLALCWNIIGGGMHLQLQGAEAGARQQRWTRTVVFQTGLGGGRL